MATADTAPKCMHERRLQDAYDTGTSISTHRMHPCTHDTPTSIMYLHTQRERRAHTSRH